MKEAVLVVLNDALHQQKVVDGDKRHGEGSKVKNISNANEKAVIRL